MSLITVTEGFVADTRNISLERMFTRDDFTLGKITTGPENYYECRSHKSHIVYATAFLTLSDEFASELIEHGLDKFVGEDRCGLEELEGKVLIRFQKSRDIKYNGILSKEKREEKFLNAQKILKVDFEDEIETLAEEAIKQRAAQLQRKIDRANEMYVSMNIQSITSLETWKNSELDKEADVAETQRQLEETKKKVENLKSSIQGKRSSVLRGWLDKQGDERITPELRQALIVKIDDGEAFAERGFPFG
jgi:hypothetical protein